jgi:DNA-directed RNA polymerase sigma subunit (sigma70/sigma32)
LATNPRKETEAPGLLAAYKARIGKGGLLSRKEEVGLGRKAQSGDSEARRWFVEKNLQLAVSVARKYRGQALPGEDQNRAHENGKIVSTHPQGVARAYLPLYIKVCWDN